jgi:hypothetical protein
MPFEPRYTEETETAITGNLMAVIDRDMKPALDYFYAVDQLPAFEVMTDGEPSKFEYPLLVLGVQRVVSSEGTQIDEADLLAQVLTVAAGIVVHSQLSLKAVREIARKYIRAFKAVIRSASVNDLFPATARTLNHTINIDHRYLKHATNASGFVQAIEMEIKITFGES